ncbi:MAG TPA: hypothetical protein VL588_01200 [Bdellovibrionota bacterium]|jgi:hypothetical protein|nr:hypothetical protein [Bdellovibrionota bacterium]
MERRHRFRTLPILLLALSIAPSLKVIAHDSYITSQLTAASGTIVEGGAFGQMGFNRHSPWFLRGEAAFSSQSADALAGVVHNNAFRFAAGLGIETKHVGGEGHGGFQTMSDPNVTITRMGASLTYRFITLVRLMHGENDLSLDDKNALLKERLAARNREVALAPSLTGEFDRYDLSTSNGLGIGQMQRIGITLRWKFHQWLQVLPSYEGFVYTFAGADKAIIQTAVANAAFRPSRIPADPPYNWYSAAPGPLASVIRVTAEWVIDFRDALSGAVVRTSTSNGRSYGGIWAAWHRRIGANGQWSVGPTAEVLQSGSNHMAAFALSMTFIPTEGYSP